ncbi:MAG: isochorismatase family cysteine hydrolase [Pseudomonadota bacterium]|nr:isochorismatase family cysteine hydrolase [Pseudomonadota bacterium]
MTDYIAVDGETPFEEIDVPLVAGHTTIVHIDLQNDFLHPDGHYAQNGIDIGHMRRVIEPIAKLTREARRRGVPIIWTRHGTRGVEDGGPFMRLRPFLKDGGLRQNTWGYEILEDLEPQPNDWYVEKTRLSGYFATNLDVILRGLKAETVIFTGVLTNQCVAATSKDASFRDYMPIVVEDCTGTTLPKLHDPAIEMMRVGWSAVSSLDDVLAKLEELPLSNR